MEKVEKNDGTQKSLKDLLDEVEREKKLILKDLKELILNFSLIKIKM